MLCFPDLGMQRFFYLLLSLKDKLAHFSKNFGDPSELPLAVDVHVLELGVGGVKHLLVAF